MKYNVLYFAWLRERIGVASETVESQAQTVQELLQELRTKDDRYAMAFEDVSSVRVAVDQTLTDFTSQIKDGQEIAFFPPMTGG